MAPLEKRGPPPQSQTACPDPPPRGRQASVTGIRTSSPQLGSQTVDTITRRTAGRLLPRSDTPGVSDLGNSSDSQLASALPGKPQTLGRGARSGSSWPAPCTAAVRAGACRLGLTPSCDLRRRPSQVTPSVAVCGSRGPRQGRRHQPALRAACRAITGFSSATPCPPGHAGKATRGAWSASATPWPAQSRTAHSAMSAGPARRPVTGRSGPGQCLCELLIDTPEARLVPETRKAPRGGRRDISIDLHPGPCTERLRATAVQVRPDPRNRG